MSIHKDKERNTWYVRWRETNKKDGTVVHKRKSGFATKKEAKAFEDEVVGINDYASFSQMVDLYIDSLKGYANDESRMYKKATLHKYAEELMPLNVRDIKKSDLLVWRNKIAGIDRSLFLKNRILQYVKAVSRFGADYYDYPDFAKTLKPFPKTSNDVYEMQVISPEDFAKIAENVSNEVYKRFFIFLYHTGCRRGEAMAITKADVEGNHVSLNKSIRRPKVGFTPLKNAQSKRSILIDQIAYDSIRPLMETDGEYLFGGLEPLSPTTITRHFDDALKKADLPHYRVHDLRHSFISNAILNGIDIVTVSKYVGHSNIEMTLNRYSHLLKDSEKNMIEKLNKIY